MDSTKSRVCLLKKIPFRFSRIVIVSSLAHERARMNWEDLNWEKNYDTVKAYCQSKLANILHAKELASRLEGTGITVYVLHPGKKNITKMSRVNYIINKRLFSRGRLVQWESVSLLIQGSGFASRLRQMILLSHHLTQFYVRPRFIETLQPKSEGAIY